MPLDVAAFQRLKAKADELQRAADKARGAYEQTMATLAAEFNVKTLKAATALADRLDKEAADATAAYDTAYAAFIAEWGWVFEESQL